MIALFSLFDSGNFYLHALFAAFIHEFGHITAAVMVKCKIRSLEFLPFGIRMKMADAIEVLPRGKSLFIIACGPSVNILCFFIISFLNKGIYDASIVHFATALFNLLPIGTLDGGKIVFEILGIWFKPQKIQQFCDIISLLLAVLLFLLGFALLIYTGYNFSLILTSIYFALVIIYKQKSKSEIFSS